MSSRKFDTFKIFCLMLFALGFAFRASASNSGITYQGRILKPDGTPLTGANVQFKMQIRTPDTANCLMYEEVQALDMRNSNGVFALTINDGSGTRTDSTGWTIDRIFGNAQGSANTFTFNPATCASGSSYLPNPSDGRSFVVYFKDETMAAYEPMPAQKINFIPMAFEAKQIAGFTPASLVRVAESDGTLDSVSPLSNANYTELLNLINGTSNQYTKQSAAAGSRVTTASGNVATPSAGSMWLDTTAGSLKFYDGTTVKTVGTAGGSVTSVATGTGLTGGPITSSGTISLATLGAGGTGYKVTYDTYGRVTGAVALVEADIPTLTTAGHVSGSAITSGTIGGTTAINTSGTINSGAITSSGLITSPSLSSTAIATQSVQIFETTNSFKVTIQAPASLSANYALTLPTTAGGVNQVLTTNGSGVLSWTTPAGTGISALTGDVSASGSGSVAATVNSVGTSTAANIHSAELLANAATNLNTVSTIVKRDGSGNFAASAITSTSNVLKDSGANTVTISAPTTVTSSYVLKLPAAVASVAGQYLSSDTSGNLSWTTLPSSMAPSGAASGDLSGTYPGPTVATVGTSTAANIHSAELAANGAVSTNTASKLVARDASGNFASNVITGNGFTLNNAGSLLNIVSPVGGAWTMTLPATAGSSGQTMISNGSGTMSWVTPLTSSTGFVNGGNSFGATASVGTNDAFRLDVKTNNAVRVTVDTAGKVGIGTTSPSSPLDVVGNINSSGNYKIGGNTVLMVPAADSTSIGVGAALSSFSAVAASYDTALGSGALSANTTGSSNTAVGYFALHGVTTQGNNAAFGLNSQYQATGNGNASFGANTMTGVATGSYNTAIGSGALGIVTTGSSNVALGNSAGSAVTTGSSNVVLGPSTGATLTTGASNILLGPSTDVPSAATNNFLDIGNAIFATGMSGTLAAPAGNVGIGTTAPATKLSVAGTVMLGDGGETCGATYAGGVRYNGGNIQFCNGTAWSTLGVAGAGITALTGDVTASGSGSVAATVASVGGSTAANVHTAELAANAATNLNTVSTIVKRDGSGNFSAGAITSTSNVLKDSGANTVTVSAPTTVTTSYALKLPAAVAASAGQVLSSDTSGNMSWYTLPTALPPNGSAGGDLSGTYPNPTVATVGTSTAANIHSAELASNGAVSTNTASKIVLRDASGNFASNVITGNGFTLNNAGSLLNIVSPIGGAWTMTMPATAGSSGQVMQTNGSGLMSWTTPLTSSTAFVNGGNAFGANASIGTNDAFRLDIKTNNVARVTVDSSGNVGIGTTAPTMGALEIRTAISGRGAFISGGGTNAGLGLGGGASAAQISGFNNSGGDAPIQLQPNGAQNVLIGNAGVPLSKLDVAGNVAIGSYAGVSAAPSNGLIVSGNVGIGTTSPQAALDVNGAIDLKGLNGIRYPATDSTAGGSIAIGAGALTKEDSLASTAFGNIAIGYQSLSSASLTATAISNTAVGYQTMASVTSTSGNTAIGYQAMSTGGGGQSSTALGSYALKNVSGDTNTGVGASAGANIGFGYRNTAIGEHALSGASTNESVAIGASAGSNVSGVNNTLIGARVASTTLTTGTGNILIGNSVAVDTPAAGTSNFLNIGNLIFGTGMSGTLAAPAGNVGIGTTAPATKLQVAGTVMLGDGGETCGATYAGAVRYNGGNIQFCNGTAWSTLGVAGAGITALTGDVTASGSGSVAATVASVGGSTAANVHAAELAANAATDVNTFSTIVKRDASGGFTAGTINLNSANAKNFVLKDTGANTVTVSAPTTVTTSYALKLPAAVAASAGQVLASDTSGNMSWYTLPTALPPNGSAGGDLSGTYPNPTVATVGTSTAANIHSAELAANGAVSTNTASKIVLRDASGNFASNVITGNGFTLNNAGSLLNIVSPIGGAWTMTMPATAGSSGQVMQTNGSGLMSWTTPLTSSTAFVNGGNAFGANASIGTNDAFRLDIKTNNVARVTIDSSGNVGIGTTSPTNALVVGPDIGATTDPSSTIAIGADASYTAMLTLGQNSANRLRLGWWGNATPANAYIVLGDKSASHPLVLQDLGGNVGIGTTSPSKNLAVYGPSQTSAIGIYPTTGGTGSSSTLYLNDDATFIRNAWGSGLEIAENGPTNIHSADYTFIYTNIGYPLKFGTNSTERMRIDPSGNIGIGTLAPNGPFSVTPSQYATGTASQSLSTVTGVGTTWTSAMIGSQFVFANGVSAGTITAVGSATSLTVTTSQTVASQNYKIAYTSLQVASSGYVGIGTTNPQFGLEVSNDISNGTIFVHNSPAGAGAQVVVGNNTADANNHAVSLAYMSTAASALAPNGIAGEQAAIWINGNYPLSFVANNNQAMTLTGAGLLGIGTTSPGARLDVSQPTAGSVAIQAQNGTAPYLKVLNPAGGATNTWNAANAVVYVGKDTGTSRSINAAGTINASGADFAEWVDWSGAKPEMGSIILYKGSYVVVSSPEKAAFVGNDTKNAEHAILVAFAGQLPVQVRGVVHEGDLIIANDDGTGFAVAKEGVTLAQSRKAVGTAWASSNAKGLKRVNVAVGIGLGGGGSRDIASVQSQLEQVNSENKKLRDENSAIKAYLCAKDPSASICK